MATGKNRISFDFVVASIGILFIGVRRSPIINFDATDFFLSIFGIMTRIRTDLNDLKHF